MHKGLKMLSLISGLATIGSLILDFVSGWADDKKLDELVDQKVNEAFEQRTATLEESNMYGSTEIGFANTEES